jgi:chromosome segregation ATPase
MIWVIVGALVVAGAGGVTTLLMRNRAPRPVTIDSFVLSEPWRRHVSSTQSIQRRYHQTVDATPAGPLHDRLQLMKTQVQRSVEECWQIANRGDELDEAIHRLRPSNLAAQLQRATDEAERASLQAQIDSADRIRALRDETDQRLTSLNTRLGELVTQAAEVSMGVDRTETLGSAVDDVVTQLQALRLAVAEVNNPGRPTTSP